jgi:hypothetical protein
MTMASMAHVIVSDIEKVRSGFPKGVRFFEFAPGQTIAAGSSLTGISCSYLAILVDYDPSVPESEWNEKHIRDREVIEIDYREIATAGDLLNLLRGKIRNGLDALLLRRDGINESEWVGAA